MSVLHALDAYYRRLDERGEVAAPGWSPEKFGWCIVLDPAGQVVDVQDLRDVSGKKPAPKQYRVPASFPRPGTTPRSFFLWDNTKFSLGVTRTEEKNKWQYTNGHWNAFRSLHIDRIFDSSDVGLTSLLRFIEGWRPEYFGRSPFHADMLDANVMFRLDGDLCFLHERAAAKALIEAEDPQEPLAAVSCLVTGEVGPPARLHPTIKGVEGAQSSGAVLVSFNDPAFRSYGKEQGENAPTTEGAAFRYGAVLNHLLTRDGPNRLKRPVGDATVVFWADASNAAAENAADALFAQWLDSDVSDEDQALKMRQQLEAVAKGKPLGDLHADIVYGTRFHVLGLSPNASRLSVRFWMTDTLDAFAQRLAYHHRDLAIEPLPRGWGAAPSVNRLLVNTTALQREYKNIPPLLAGEMMRAVLTGGRYPFSLFSAALIRLRAGDDPASGWHAAVIRAVLVRLGRRNPELPEQGETPMSLKRDHANAGYQLGRLFAVYELAQRAALGRVNASIRDRYFAAASATPASVFPLVVRGAQNHLAKVRKNRPGWAALIERELEEINGRFDPRPEGTLPRSLRLQDQGEFVVGYYHQRSAKLSSDKGEVISSDDLNETTGNHEAE
jgi:CRISPR-associated protein Csd1